MNENTGKIVAVIAAILILGGGIFWFANREDDSQSDSQNNSSQQSDNQSTSNESTAANIVVLATNTSDLSTLVTAVKAVELVDTLQGQGPFTVFAPTNVAFNALPEGTLATLLKPENKEQLKAVLTYHVVSGQVLAQDLKDGQEITTVQGGKLKVKIADGKVYLIDAKGNQVTVEKADVDASNGVVHIIGGVLLP